MGAAKQTLVAPFEKRVPQAGMDPFYSGARECCSVYSDNAEGLQAFHQESWGQTLADLQTAVHLEAKWLQIQIWLRPYDRGRNGFSGHFTSNRPRIQVRHLSRSCP